MRTSAPVLLEIFLVWRNNQVKPVTFLKNVAREMKKVSWPGREELFRYTLTVVATVAFIAIFFTIVDMGITQILNLLFD